MTEQEFKNSVFLFTDYEENLLNEFFEYWSEPNKKGKMRWELEKTWDLKRRLKRWEDNQIKWGKSLNIKKELHGSSKVINQNAASTFYRSAEEDYRAFATGTDDI